jgi:hypothetical protein
MLLYPMSPEDDSSSEPESCSDTTLHEEDDAALFLKRRDSLTAGCEEDDDDDDDDDDAVLPSLFPFHLLSGCSSAGRAMCQISQTITSRELQGRIGLKGMSCVCRLTWTWRGGPPLADPHQSWAPGSVRAVDPGRAVIAPRQTLGAHDAICRNDVLCGLC